MDLESYGCTSSNQNGLTQKDEKDDEVILQRQ